MIKQTQTKQKYCKIAKQKKNWMNVWKAFNRAKRKSLICK